MSDPVPICRHCFLRPEEHHHFEAIAIPAGCKCDPRDWKSLGILEMTPVCDAFVGDDVNLCARCDHLEECHARQRDAGTTTND